ncbi:MAG: YeeE/YedE thiosulfate transporter family protein [Planctomycetota bacterium]|jgi:uncharacterized membrane protein YedE/YeeE
MGNFLCSKRWNPYLAGALAGLLAVLSVFVSTKVLSKPKYLGTSTTFVRAVGLAEKALWNDHVEENAYFQATKVKADWQMLLVAGIFLGALLSSLLGRSYRGELVPPIWRERFGNRPLLRAVCAFLGGVIALFGVRLAGGCPSGHGLSGMMQLSVSGVIAMVCFLAGGIVTARILYKGGK